MKETEEYLKRRDNNDDGFHRGKSCQTRSSDPTRSLGLTLLLHGPPSSTSPHKCAASLGSEPSEWSVFSPVSPPFERQEEAISAPQSDGQMGVDFPNLRLLACAPWHPRRGFPILPECAM